MKPFYQSILLIIFYFICPVSEAQKANAQDSLVLVDFYKSTAGASWTNHTGWLAGPVSGWYGVTLDAKGRVSQIYMVGNNISGSLPASIGNLTGLTYLRLSSNNINGGVPAEIGNLTQLTYLSLLNNKLAGSLPAELNNLVGMLPSLSNLTKLTLASFTYNYFIFDGFEELLKQFPSASFSPQYNIPIIFSNKTFKATAGGTLSNNTYYWYKGKTLVATKTGNASFTPSTGGYYYVKVTNKVASTLELTSDSLNALYITSFSPASGTYRTKVTIKGGGFSTLHDIGYGTFGFGGFNSDSAAILSDSVAQAWVGEGGSGDVTVGSAKLSGFTYNPVTLPADIGWHYVGPVKAIADSSYYVSGACGTDNLPVIIYQDFKTLKTMAIKLSGNSFKPLGNAVSDKTSLLPSIVIDHSNKPIIAYIDSKFGGNLVVKKFNGTSWDVVGAAGFAQATSYSMAIDKNDVIYIALFNLYGDQLCKVYKYDGAGWNKISTDNFIKTLGSLSIAVSKVNNMPYLLFDDFTQPASINGYPKASVVSYDGSKWATVGKPGFTTGGYGFYYGDMSFDEAGNPLAFTQDDDGFERATMYKFINGAWQTLGGKNFTKGHTYSPYFTVTKKGDLYSVFVDRSYNKLSSVMHYNKTNGAWEYAGAQGGINTIATYRNTIFVDNNDVPWVAFTNMDGYAVSVMQLNVPALPITLLNLTGNRNKTDVQLNWQTAQEINTGNYAIERSFNGADFTGIGNVQAAGNSSVKQSYSYIDANAAALNTQTLYYRLKIVDKDGSFNYSKIISLQNDGINTAYVLYPNPARTSATIQFTASASAKYTVTITSAEGKVIKRLNIAATTGVNRAVLNVGSLAHGTYIVTITGDKDKQTLTLVKE